jgi:hypothetical protein
LRAFLTHSLGDSALITLYRQCKAAAATREGRKIVVQSTHKAFVPLVVQLLRLESEAY